MELEITATRTEPMPKELKKWIKGFCQGKEHVVVAHRMAHSKEHLGNVTLEESLNLIRYSELFQAYVGEGEMHNPARQELVKKYVADCVKKIVLAKFDKAYYCGD